MYHHIVVIWEGKQYRHRVTGGYELRNPFFVVHDRIRPRWWFKKRDGQWMQFAYVTPLDKDKQWSITTGLDQLLKTIDFKEWTLTK